MNENEGNVPCWFQVPLLVGLGILVFSNVAGILYTHAATVQFGTATIGIGQFIVVRTDGAEQRLEGQGSLPLYEGDVIRTEGTSQGLLKLNDGIQVAVNENSTILLLSRWEQAKGITPILRLTSGEIWAKIVGGTKQLEVETPVAIAAMKRSEFDIKVHQNGETILTVIDGMVEFGPPFNTWKVTTDTISSAAPGKKCTKPAGSDAKLAISWVDGVRTIGR